jgi:hypothetical protein
MGTKVKLCCETGVTHICGGPGAWDFGDNHPGIIYCPWCGTKLPEKNICKFEVVVRYDRGLGAEFKTKEVEADNMADAKKVAEDAVAEELRGSKFNVLGSQVRPIKA